MQRLLERKKIIKGDADAVGQQRLKAGTEHVVAIERQRSIREAMKRMLAVDDPRTAGGGMIDDGLVGRGQVGAEIGRKGVGEFLVAARPGRAAVV